MRSIKLLLVGLVLLNAPTSLAVDCPAPGTPSAELKRAAAVFSGEVVAEEYKDVGPDAPEEDAGAKVLVVRIKVERWWKGGSAREVTMRTSVTKLPDGSIRSYAEDFHFTKGGSYLIYAFAPKGKLGTSACTRTRKLSEAEDDLRELGEGSTPVEANN